MASISHCPADTQHRVRIDIKSLFWRLPYSLRRKAFLLLCPGLASYYEKLLHGRDGEYSIRPMLAQKCLFIHIPKCAGIAVSNALFNCRAGGHLPLSHYQLIITPQLYKRLFKFTVVRNPYARLLSAYTFLASGGLTNEDAAWSARVLSAYGNFSEFVEGWLTPDRAQRTLHFRPQIWFLKIPGRKISDIDFIAHQETLSTDFDYICQTLGIANALLGRQNRSSPPETDYRALYSLRARQIATEIYREDLAHFSYRFEELPPVPSQ